MSRILDNLAAGGEIYDIPDARDEYPCFEDTDYQWEYQPYNPDEENRRKDWLESYAAEAADLEPDELPF